MQSHRAIAGALAEQASVAKNEASTIPTLSGTTADFLQQISVIDPQGKSDADFSIYPVLVSKTLKGNNFRKKLQQTVICYRDKRARIKHVLCNQQLDWNQI